MRRLESPMDRLTGCGFYSQGKSKSGIVPSKSFSNSSALSNFPIPQKVQFYYS